jgi:hypothetical protein
MSTQLQQTEKQFEQAVVDYSKLMGWLSYHNLDSRGSEPGFPDRVFLRAPRILFVELKTETGRVSAAQQQWIDELEAVERASLEHALGSADGQQLVQVRVWRPSMWDEITAVLR